MNWLFFKVSIYMTLVDEMIEAKAERQWRR